MRLTMYVSQVMCRHLRHAAASHQQHRHFIPLHQLKDTHDFLCREWPKGMKHQFPNKG